MRIIGGVHGGRKLHTPSGRHIRPTSDRVKEALFSILAGSVAGAAVLDLFAGTGSLALEALSRGAAEAVCVEADKRALAVLRKNVRTVGLEETVRILPQRVQRALPVLGAEGCEFDIVFLDPPYKKGLVVRTVELLSKYSIVSKKGLIAAEHSQEELKELQSLAGFSAVSRREYGSTALTFLVDPAQLQENSRDAE